jgi:hypothetical protein
MILHTKKVSKIYRRHSYVVTDFKIEGILKYVVCRRGNKKYAKDPQVPERPQEKSPIKK